jgi:ABC-type phosphate transport system, permease component
LDVLWGIPSIVYGAFGFLLMLTFHLRASLLAGMITVALVELPILSRAMDETVRLVPAELKEAAYSLGASRWQTATRVTLRQAFPGLITAILIALGRGLGDAASVLFTAGYTDRNYHFPISACCHFAPWPFSSSSIHPFLKSSSGLMLQQLS